jgi:hypothetical protein
MTDAYDNGKLIRIEMGTERIKVYNNFTSLPNLGEEYVVMFHKLDRLPTDDSVSISKRWLEDLINRMNKSLEGNNNDK